MYKYSGMVTLMRGSIGEKKRRRITQSNTQWTTERKQAIQKTQSLDYEIWSKTNRDGENDIKKGRNARSREMAKHFGQSKMLCGLS